MGTAKEKPLIWGRNNVWHFIQTPSFCPNFFHVGILVRNDAVKDRLQQRLQGSLIMLSLTFSSQLSCLTHAHRTLYESKGLEFNDVGFTILPLILLPTKPRSCCTTSSRILQQPQINGVWCLMRFPVGLQKLQPLMKHDTRASV